MLKFYKLSEFCGFLTLLYVMMITQRQFFYQKQEKEAYQNGA